MKEFAVYTALRTGIFVGIYAVLGGVAYMVADSLSPVWPLVLAAIISMVVSSWLLRERRERLAEHIAQRAARAAEAAQEGSQHEEE